MEGREAAAQVVYPVRDDTPMGESDLHIDTLKDYAINVLRDHFADQADAVYVAGNNFLYFVEGDPRQVVSPDTYVVRGVAQRQRDTFKVWNEGGHTPCWVLEITSRTTRTHDLGDKMARYRDDLRVPEYVLFDPRGDWIEGQLRGYRLDTDGLYQAIPATAAGRLPCQALGLEVGVMAGLLRFYAPGSDDPLPTRAEQATRATERATEAEAELARLRAELERLRGDGR